MALTEEAVRFVEDIRSPLDRILTLGVQHGPDIGATDSMDVSAYEGASIIHDLNMSISKELRKQFDMVVDGGSLEHVYDLRMAIDNCFWMLKDGGWFVSYQVCNFTGHGFVGLSPEYLKRWSIARRMERQKCWVFSPLTRILREVDMSLDERLEFTSITHFYMLFRAQKTDESTYLIPPQQSGPAEPSNFLKRWLWETRIWRWPRVK